MIVSGKLQQAYAKMWSSGILLFAMLVVPVGAVDAQDFEAVERRLGKAVSKGELSLQQAKVMMDVLRETAGHEHAERPARVRERTEQQLREVGAELKAAVAAGKITEQQAWDKWNGFKEHEIAPQLKAAVREGQMPEREAWEIWRGIEKAEAGERLKAAVAKGELTEEEAKAKWAEIEKGFADRRARQKNDSGDSVERQKISQ